VRERHTILRSCILIIAGLPLPRTVHATLLEEQLDDGRIIVIGDVHGCPQEVKALLHKCVSAMAF
jgi:hypothetical protein